MYKFKYHYPGDPVLECVVMNRREFLDAFPRTPTIIRKGLGPNAEIVETIHNAPDYIACDLCSEDPGGEIYVICNGSRGYCKKCAEHSIIPHKVQETPKVRYVLTHPEDGIYLGNCMGFGFWTKIDPVGQPEACTFESEQDMWDHINSWDQSDDLERRKLGFRAIPVIPSKGTYATIQDCVDAGLEPWDPEMNDL